jgi:predicted DNA-binding transcriptional regulator YafY
MLSSSSRLLRVLSLLQTRSHWAGNELSERLEIHPRTLRRDIDRLRQLGYPIHASSGVAGGYAFRAGQALPPMLLDDDEALAVAVALRIATAGSVGGVEESSLRALIKLEQVMPARLRKRIDALRAAILPMERMGPTVKVSALSSLATACRDQLRVDFAYLDSKGNASQRTVEPQGLVHTGYRWYLVAWDPARGDWRTFRIDRMTGEPANGTHFKPRPGPDGGDLRAYVSRSIAAPHQTEQARIILHAPHQAMAQRISPSVGTLEPAGDARSLLCCSATDQSMLVYWLMALDVEFEVLEPPSLRKRLQAAGDRLARSLARHSADNTTSA